MAQLEKAFVTGAGGFVGRHLVRRLLAERVEVVALIMPNEPVPDEWGTAVRFVTADVRNLHSVAEDIGPFDTLFHLAAIVSDWGSQDEHVATTVRGTEQAIALALEQDAHFIVTSSVCAYASALAKGDLSEDMPVGKAVSPYESCKQEQERLTRRAVGVQGLKGSIVRPGNVFGVGSGPWVVGMVEMMRVGSPAIMGSGDWDAGLCHVDNLVELLVLLARSDYCRGEVFNAADGFGVTWNTYLNRLAQTAHTPPPRSVNNFMSRHIAAPLEWLARLTGREERPPVTRQSWRLLGGPNRFLTDKARDLLGYQPVVSFEQAMTELASDYGYSAPEEETDWVWVTGSGSGLGCYLTGQLLQKGYRVLATDQNIEALRAKAQEQCWPSDRVVLEKLDVSVRKQWQDMASKYLGEGVRFSHLLNVAGIIRPGYSYENMARDIGAQVRVNLTGTVNGCDALLPHFRDKASGHIINIASLAGFGPIPGVVGYCVSKTAVRSFSNGLAMDLAVAGSPVKVSCVCPDLIATPMMDQQLEYEDHARLVFSGDRPLTTEKVGSAILGKVWRDRPMELAMPARRAWMARVMGPMPNLSLWGSRRLEDKGRRRLAQLKK